MPQLLTTVYKTPLSNLCHPQPGCRTYGKIDTSACFPFSCLTQAAPPLSCRSRETGPGKVTASWRPVWRCLRHQAVGVDFCCGQWGATGGCTEMENNGLMVPCRLGTRGRDRRRWL